MANGEENSANRIPKLSSPPDGYIRRSTLLQTLGAIVGVFGAIIGLYRFFDGRDQRIRADVSNERHERIAADARINDRIDRCCTRRGQ